MALVKTSALAGKRTGATRREDEAHRVEPPAKLPVSQRRLADRRRARHEKAAERVGAATEELASGIGQAAAAAEQLRRALEQIASAAEEAAGAAQQSQEAVKSLGTVFVQSRDRAAASRQQTDQLETILGELAVGIEALVASVQEKVARQLASAELVAALEQQAAEIGEITAAVGDISEQTNLLALNAAIEAARAGVHGRGFAVVADEVRALAETSERSARDVKSLAEAIGGKVRDVVQRIGAAGEQASHEARQGQAVVDSLGAMRSEMGALAEGAQSILAAMVESETGAREAQRGSEQVAAAAEQQSAAAQQAQRAVQHQSAALEQSQRTAESLAAIAERLQSATGADSSGEQIASAAEQLSSTVQELSGSAGQILAAIEQISRGAQVQSAATHELSVAMAQIERAAASTRAAAEQAVQRSDALGPLLSANLAEVTALSLSLETGLDELRALTALVGSLEVSNRQIEKIVDRIGLVSVQTNMLAVSGAIEAAREGEHGQGFAIVSSDIRTLARDSSENSDRIREVVRSIRDRVAAVRQGLDSIAAATLADVARNRALGERFDTVQASMATIRQGGVDVLQGAAAVARAATQVLAGTTEIATAAEEAAGAAAEAAAAAREQAQGAESLAAAIEEIASLADELGVTEG